MLVRVVTNIVVGSGAGVCVESPDVPWKGASRASNEQGSFDHFVILAFIFHICTRRACMYIY